MKLKYSWANQNDWPTWSGDSLNKHRVLFFTCLRLFFQSFLWFRRMFPQQKHHAIALSHAYTCNTLSEKRKGSKSAWQHACTFFLASGPEYVKTWKKAVGQRLMKSGQEVILEVTERMHRGTGDMTTGVPSRAWHSPQIMSAFFPFFNMNHLKTLF